MTGVVERISRLLMYVSMVVILLMALHVTASVALRWTTGRDIPLTLEITAAYYMVALTFLPLALIDLSQRHIRAEFLFMMLPVAVRRVLSVLIRLAMFGYLALLTWRTFLSALTRTRARDEMITVLGYMPIWPARWLVPCGLFVATCAALILVVMALRGADDDVSDETSLKQPVE